MSTFPRGSVDRETAERLLGGAVVAGQDELARLLADACAPPRPGELGGEEAAMRAFRTHRATGFDQTERHPTLRAKLAKLLTVKVAVAAAIAVAVTGGAALAATTGALPGPFGDVMRTDHPKRDRSPERSPDRLPPPAGRTVDPSPGPSTAAGLGDLCRAYLATDRANRGNVLKSARYRELVAAAGGKNDVDTYCADLLAADASGSGTSPGKSPGRPDRPAHSAHPTGQPAHSTGPGEHPTGKPVKPTKGSTPDGPGRQER